MRSFVKILLCCMLPAAALAQIDPTWGYINKIQADSLRYTLSKEKRDTLNIAAVRKLGFYYQESISDSAVYFHEEQLRLAKKLGLKMWEADAYSQAGYVYTLLGNAIKAYEYFLAAQKLADDKENEASNWRPWTFSNAENLHNSRIAILAMNYQMMGNVWIFLDDKEKRKDAYLQAAKLGESIDNGKIVFASYASLASQHSADSAIQLLRKGVAAASASGYPGVSWAYMNMVLLFAEKNMYDSALVYASRTKAACIAVNDMRTLSNLYQAIAGYHYGQGNKDSALYYAKESHAIGQIAGITPEMIAKNQTMAYAYSFNGQPDSAAKFWQLTYQLSDSIRLVQIDNLKRYQKQAFNEQLRLKKMEEERTAYENRMKVIGLLALVTGVLVVALILYRNNRQKHKANKVLEQTLADLTSTQAQLVQSEKMASLGELTAGIAHEIQNPLNFVNNFSEVSNELIDEMNEELNKGDIEEAKAISSDIKQNLEKINHHGKRADAIVKGMLQHSQSSSRKKEPTDINKLADEYLRLAYHGLRARDKSFNATLKTDYDEAIGMADIIPQDIGRVIMNLLTNAFYAVNEKARSSVAGKYEPTVSISTKRTGNSIHLIINDNGNGIALHIKEKIFQPFFTTKPTGQGTGLGLSLSYDIITKGHGGQLKVETKENEGSTFIVSLPLVQAITENNDVVTK